MADTSQHASDSSGHSALHWQGRQDLYSSGTEERCQAVYVRDHNESSAMDNMQRLQTRFKKFIYRVCHCHFKNESRVHKKDDDDAAAIDGSGDVDGLEAGDDDDADDEIDALEGTSGAVLPRFRQYRLEAVGKRGKKWKKRLRILSSLFCCDLSALEVGTGTGYNQWLARYMNWMFRVNFFMLFLAMCILFFALTLLFSGFIMASGVLNPKCVRAEGGDFGSLGTRFADAFSLSWTTFSTVGFGSTYPALGSEAAGPTRCIIVTIVCCLEAFVGVMYSGFCGAIVFGKVLRIQSHAQVIFSEPIVVRYGSGVQENIDFDDQMDEGVVEKTTKNKYKDVEGSTRKKNPLPVLEFRIVNSLFGQPGGEVMDATLQVVANVDANDADSSMEDSESQLSSLTSVSRRSEWDKKSSQSRVISDLTSEETRSSDHSDDIITSNSNHPPSLYSSTRARIRQYSWGSMPVTKLVIDPLANIQAAAVRQLRLSSRDNQAVDEDPTARLVSKRVFSKLLIEASEHPFFKRVWLARHVLDETSPILKPAVRRRIRRNGGHWPEKLNTYEAVRENLQFNQILVSLTGVSNISAANVYAQKIYDYVDIHVGYQFVNILYRDSDGELKVDTDLINDVREQGGGGGEPFISG